MTRRQRRDRLSPDGPCEKFDCEMAPQCKAQKLACPGFRSFVAYGRRQVPWPSEASRKIYDEVFPQTDPEDGGW